MNKSHFFLFFYVRGGAGSWVVGQSVQKLKNHDGTKKLKNHDGTKK